ncbi:3-oxoacyl-ACP synthase [Blastochloris sulfoviridis]|uniref:3-oxoacyl-ACP synthase n=2 Tax=Blastochloris sulfoviridis TaxID=50712 RepID=A0A5M6I297_9HYPH|nr:3-oxoacyl-ACP synthase [Blastochloris sulfoviridis]
MTEAVLIDGNLYVKQPDGSLRPSAGKTDFAKLAAMSEEEIEAAALNDPDALPMTDEQWAEAMKVPRKRYIHLGVDDDVLSWFKSHGRGYQTRINAVLRRYVETHRKAG